MLIKVNDEERSLFAQHRLAENICDEVPLHRQLHVILGQKPKTIDFVKRVIELLKNPNEISKIIKFGGTRMADVLTSKPLNVIKLDLTYGLENFVEQVKLNQPADDKTNVYLIETYDESILRHQWREYEKRLCQLVRPFYQFVQIGQVFKEWRDNATIIIIAEQPPRLLDYFKKKDAYTCFDLTGLTTDIEKMESSPDEPGSE